MRAVFLDYASLDQDDLDLAPLHHVFTELTLYPATSAAQLPERIQGMQVVISNKVVLDAKLLAANPELKLILISATGTNNVDLQAAKAQGIVVSNCQGYGTASVAQHCLMLLLNLARNLPAYQQAISQGAWQQASQFCLLDYPIMELHGKTLGILGSGELGSAFAQLAQALGMKVLYGALPGRPARSNRLPLNELLPQLDALSLHCPLTEQTQGLIGAAELALLPKHALLINTARGGIVDEQALADALRAGHLGGAACDVLSQEPPRDGNPLLAADIPRLIITPHIAWGSREARQRIVAQLAENAASFINGAPKRVVNG